jgi:predicted RND superfamily exporter protein
MQKILSKPWIIIGIVLVVTVLFGTQVPKVVLDNDVLAFFPDDHDSYIRMKALDDVYESQIMFDICITENEGTFLNHRTIEAIREISEKVENMAVVDDVTSIISTDFPDGSAEGMVIEPLVGEDFTGTDEELAQLKTNLLDWPDMYKNSLYSEDFRSTQVFVVINKDADHEEKNAVYNEIYDFTRAYDWLDIRVAGDPVISHDAEIFMIADLTALIPLVLLVLLISLYFSFHRKGGTLLPMITVLITTIWTVGLMATFGVALSIVSTCLPVLIIAIGSAYGIHVMNHYYSDMRKTNGHVSVQDHKTLVIDSVKHVLKPVILAGFTTIVGFSSIMTSPIVPLKTFGLFSTVGTIIALVLSLVFIPSLIIAAYKDKEKKNAGKMQLAKEKRQERSMKRMEAVFNKMSNHRVGILISAVVFIIVSIYGLTEMNIESALIEYFPEDSSLRVNADYISDHFAGTNTFNVVLKGDEPGDVIDPQVLKEMDNLKTYLMERNPDIGKIMTYSDFIKRMNQIMNFPSDGTEEDYGSYDDMGSFDDDSSMGSFFGDDSADSGSFFGDDSADSGSFFGDDSADSDTGSFFGGDAFDVEEQEVFVSSFQPLDLSEDLTWTTLLDLTRKIVNEKGTGTLSIEDLTEEVEKAFNIRGKAYYEIPSDPTKYPAADNEELKNLISQYLLLYSGSLDKFSDDSLEPTQVRMLVQIKESDTAIVSKILDDVNDYAAIHFPENIKVENSGVAEITKALTDMVTSSQIISLLTALVAVFIIVSIAYKSPIAGLFGIIPLFLSILINFGLMGITGINLDMITALVASIAIGVGVDYTIHFLSAYKFERLQSDDLNLVTKNTILTSGKGIITNAVSVGLGFAVLVFSKFVVLRYIGILVAVIMLTSSVAALTILPALLNLFKPKFISKK